MSGAGKIAFIGNSLPRRCGIATFTTDLRRAVAQSMAPADTCIIAMTDHEHTYDYPPEVRMQVHADRLVDYERAAHYLNASRAGVVSLQHEFGIFGGEAGAHITTLLSLLRMPIVTTLHTVLAQPTAVQRAVCERILGLSSQVIVMAEKGRELLQSTFQLPAAKISVIPHGTPDVPYSEPDEAKELLGFAGRCVILTFGLLSPGKGIGVMIDAMPEIIRRRPDAVYVVLGATHPNLIRAQGETYREGLQARVHELGIEQHVVFLDQFVDQELLLRFIAMCDVYVTPYLNEAQMTSGTLAYSYGLGKAVVSTPYWHARELLADGRGILVPFGDAAAIGNAIAALLTDEARRLGMRERAYADSRPMTWPRVAEQYVAAFNNASQGRRARVVAIADAAERIAGPRRLPEICVSHLRVLSDDTGLFQHARHCVPDRAHGYCTDDNARALLVACALAQPGEQSLPQIMVSRYAAFLLHAWNAGRQRFRNFMAFDRRWLDDAGSEDSHGRALWALGECTRSALEPTLCRWARELFAEALPAAEHFRSPRAWSFALLGLDAWCASVSPGEYAPRLRQQLADQLMSLLTAVRNADWIWFEEGLAYDNPRMAQALLATGRATANRRYVDAGLQSLRWLMALQTTSEGTFRPVGSQGFAARRSHPSAFDQQPLEAAAAVSACLAASRVDADPSWESGARRAIDWFGGHNDLGVPLVDPATGSCRDGLHPDRANENCGGESAVSWLLALAEMRLEARANGERSARGVDRVSASVGNA